MVTVLLHRIAVPVNITLCCNQKTILMLEQTRQATDFKRTIAAAEALPVDYNDDISCLHSQTRAPTRPRASCLSIFARVYA